jgi:hypothetical protein
MPIVSETSDCVPVLKPYELPTSRYRRRELRLMSRQRLLPASDLERSAAHRRCVAWPQGLAGAWAA